MALHSFTTIHAYAYTMTTVCWCFLGRMWIFRLWVFHKFVSKCLDIVPLILVFLFHFSTFFCFFQYHCKVKLPKKSSNVLSPHHITSQEHYKLFMNALLGCCNNWIKKLHSCNAYYVQWVSGFLGEDVNK
jgi:hypothetical protein